MLTIAQRKLGNKSFLTYLNFWAIVVNADGSEKLKWNIREPKDSQCHSFLQYSMFVS